jgi:hypothetical protein
VIVNTLDNDYDQMLSSLFEISNTDDQFSDVELGNKGMIDFDSSCEMDSKSDTIIAVPGIECSPDPNRATFIWVSPPKPLELEEDLEAL